MIHFNVGDIIKSTTYKWLDGAKIIKIECNVLYFVQKDGKTRDDYRKDTIIDEIKTGHITHIPGKILNWKERIQ